MRRGRRGVSHGVIAVIAHLHQMFLNLSHLTTRLFGSAHITVFYYCITLVIFLYIYFSFSILFADQIISLPATAVSNLCAHHK